MEIYEVYYEGSSIPLIGERYLPGICVFANSTDNILSGNIGAGNRGCKNDDYLTQDEKKLQKGEVVIERWEWVSEEEKDVFGDNVIHRRRPVQSFILEKYYAETNSYLKGWILVFIGETDIKRNALAVDYYKRLNDELDYSRIFRSIDESIYANLEASYSSDLHNFKSVYPIKKKQYKFVKYEHFDLYDDETMTIGLVDSFYKDGAFIFTNDNILTESEYSIISDDYKTYIKAIINGILKKSFFPDVKTRFDKAHIVLFINHGFVNVLQLLYDNFGEDNFRMIYPYMGYFFKEKLEGERFSIEFIIKNFLDIDTDECELEIPSLVEFLKIKDSMYPNKYSPKFEELCKEIVLNDESILSESNFIMFRCYYFKKIRAACSSRSINTDIDLALWYYTREKIDFNEIFPEVMEKRKSKLKLESIRKEDDLTITSEQRKRERKLTYLERQKYAQKEAQGWIILLVVSVLGLIILYEPGKENDLLGILWWTCLSGVGLCYANRGKILK